MRWKHQAEEYLYTNAQTPVHACQQRGLIIIPQKCIDPCFPTVRGFAQMVFPGLSKTKTSKKTGAAGLR